jgi:hypothetical protein
LELAMAERSKDMFFTESSINDMAEAIKKYYPGEHHISIIVNGEEKTKMALNIYSGNS